MHRTLPLLLAPIALPAVLLFSPAALADPPPPVVTEQTTSQAVGPSMPMVVSGIVIFGLSYVPAVAVGSSSGLDADRTLLVPIAGPWIDLTQRPGCNGGSGCNTENTNKVLLVTDGVFQAIGVLTTLGGFLTTAHERTTVQSADSGLKVQVSPASFGDGSYGMKALGTF